MAESSNHDNTQPQARADHIKQPDHAQPSGSNEEMQHKRLQTDSDGRQAEDLPKAQSREPLSPEETTKEDGCEQNYSCTHHAIDDSQNNKNTKKQTFFFPEALDSAKRWY